MYKQRLFLKAVFLFSFLPVIAGAQTGLRFSYLKFSGEMGYTITSGLMPELFFEFVSDNEHFVFGAGLGYMNGKPRRDTFPTYGIMNGSTLLPGYTVIHKFNLIPISFYSEYLFLKERDFTPFVALDACVNIVNYDMDHAVETVITSSESTGGVSIGFQPRAGVRYSPNDRLSFTAGIGRCGAFITGDLDPVRYWKPSISVVYKIFED